MDPTNTTDLPACASQDGAHPPIALTADAGAQTGRPVIAPVRDIDDLPIHGDLEDRAEQVVRHISHDVRRNGWSWGEGVSW